jgi:DNA-binding NarL/FixJ family response regulator
VPAPSRPLRLALVDDHAIVVKGLASMLADHADRVEVVELDSLRDPVEDVDVVLKDSFGMVDDLRDFVRVSRAPVVVFAFSSDKTAVQEALEAGAAGYVFKGVSEERLVSALERVHAGQQVVEVDEGVTEDAFVAHAGDWPGRDEGLTERESEILALICRGLSNQEVAGTLFLSINSIKTYIRSLYRKIGAESRSQAVIWGLDHDFVPRPWRHRP